MTTLVFFLEKRSAKAILEGLLPRILPTNINPKFIVFEGKQDLEKKLTKRLKLWQDPSEKFIVMCDQDQGDCHAVKANLLQKCRDSGKINVLVRIACHELESFYLGDLEAVSRGFEKPKVIKQQKNKKFRNPNRFTNSSQELKN